jgi:UDP-N-acetylglucosamine 1-carboxyvinyltransferase
MDTILIKGGKSLNGKIDIAGAKNACLALMPLTLLTEDKLTLTNAPKLSDINTFKQLLESLGAEIEFKKSGREIILSTPEIKTVRADYEIVRKMRASNLVLGPLLAREGHAIVSLPGGCAIGARPMDIHIDALEMLGAKIDLRDGYLFATAAKGLRGCAINLPFASVGATENLIMAASMAKGTTIITNAACEPEVGDMIECLISMGAIIEGKGTSKIIIEGVSQLYSAKHAVISDRIEMGTYMLAPIIAGGEVEIIGGNIKLLEAFSEKLISIGVTITNSLDGVIVKGPDDRLQAIDVKTEIYPGFPTDLQAQMMALLTTANGTSILHETIFENRFMHAPELIRMGAKIDISGGKAVVEGVSRLKGAPVMATDLRASVSMILAALAAEGETVVNRVYHLDRGYENVEEKLSNCGAIIERIIT